MRKLALVVASLAVVGLGLWLWPDHPSSTTIPEASTPAAPPARSTTAAPAAPSPAPASTKAGPYSRTSPAKKAWEPVVEGFALAYPDTAGISRKQWLTNLRPYLTHAVIDDLADTDLGKVPAGHYAGYQILKQADETLTVRVTYQEGWALVLYIAAAGPNRWRIDAFDFTQDFDD